MVKNVNLIEANFLLFFLTLYAQSVMFNDNNKNNSTSDPSIILMQVASSNYEKDARYLRTILLQIIRMVHGRESDFHFGAPEYMFGWAFSTLSINSIIVHQLIQLFGDEILKGKGSSIDQKFVEWLKKKHIKKNLNIDIKLVSDLKSSRFGLF
jgi:hypothetical protein